MADKTKKTKRTTESVDDAILRLIGGEDMKLVHSLTHEEQAMFYEIVEQVRRRDDMGVSMSDLWRVDYVQPPPSIETFITDPYWLGATMAPSADNEGIFPCWRDVMLKDFDLDSCVHNVVVTGSLGVGKCHAAGDFVVMFDGTLKNVEKVVEGDVLMGDDGTPRRVLTTCTGEAELFQISPANGEPFTVTGHHTLCLKKSADDVVAELSVYACEKLPRAEREELRLYRVVPNLPCFKEIAPLGTEALKTVFRVVPQGVGKFYGFTLDGNHRYLLRDFTVTHNSWVMSAIFLYRITLARLLRDPQNFFGLSKGSQIYYVLLSLTRAVVSDTIFADIQNFMANSEFFRSECKFDPDKKYAALRINLGNNITLSAGSKGWHIIGRNTMGVGLDEGNWRLEANPDMKAYALYDEVRTRIKNRFQSLNGFLPAISILSSSAKDESSFTENVIGDINESGDKNQKIYRFAVWVAKRHKLRLSNKWFKVAYGLKNIEPCVLQGEYTEDGKIAGDGFYEEPPNGSSVLMVPWDYHDDFVRRTRINLQSLGGISTGGSMRLFPNTIDLEIMVDMAEEQGIRSPNLQGSELIPLSAEDDKEMWDHLDHKAFLTRRNSRVQPIRAPGVPRFAHVDLATSGVAGLAICHLAGTKKVDGVISDEGEPFAEHRSIVEFDFILAITPGPSKPISLEKIQRFFFWLRDYCGYHFDLITYDQFQSAQMLQMMESRNFVTKNLSVDKTKLPYYTLRGAIAEHRIVAYRHPVLIRELEELHDGTDKVDHPDTENGSKDAADSFCGAAFNALSSNSNVSGTSADVPAIVGGGSGDLEKNDYFAPIRPEYKPAQPMVFDT